MNLQNHIKYSSALATFHRIPKKPDENNQSLFELLMLLNVTPEDILYTDCVFSLNGLPQGTPEYFVESIHDGQNTKVLAKIKGKELLIKKEDSLIFNVKIVSPASYTACIL